jgi:lipopolysaccharide/colanic/teichoic acid biosynthesis glycosyltransferase
MKRIFDIIVAFIALTLLSPIFLLIFLIIKITSYNRNDVFYKGVRAGKNNVNFKIYKFRTMIQDTENIGGYSTALNDFRLTKIGRFLRKFKLDELPQFWSVLKGDMSIVGPRPLSVLHYERDRSQGNVTRFLLRGGLLGFGHINKGTSEMGNPIYEYEYVDQYLNRSSFGLLCLDLWIIWKGFLVIIKGGGH